MLVNSAWAWEPPWNVVDNTQKHCTEKANLPFDGGWGWNFVSASLFTPSVLRLLSGLNLYGFLGLLSVFVSPCVTCSDVSRRLCFLEVIHHQNKGIKTNHLPCPLEATVLTASLSLVKGPLRRQSLSIVYRPGFQGWDWDTSPGTKSSTYKICPACKMCWGHGEAELVGGASQ